MLAREAEAASWTQRRQMYAAGGAPAAAKRPDYSNAWTVPTIGFPPPPLPPPPHPMQHFGRPLHVWGHPTPGVESPRVPMWPRHLAPRASTPPWAPPPSDPAFWHHPYMRVRLHMSLGCIIRETSVLTDSILAGACTYAGPGGSLRGSANASRGKGFIDELSSNNGKRYYMQYIGFI